MTQIQYGPNDETQVIPYDPIQRETKEIPVKRTDSQLLRSINEMYSRAHSRSNGGRKTSDHLADKRNRELTHSGVLEVELDQVPLSIEEFEEDLDEGASDGTLDALLKIIFGKGKQ